jgi:hypothetical protein
MGQRFDKVIDLVSRDKRSILDDVLKPRHGASVVASEKGSRAARI